VLQDIRFSLIHATYRSPGVSRIVRDRWFHLANSPSQVEHCMAFQHDDDEIRQEYGIDNSPKGTTPDLRSKFITTGPQDSPSAVRNWNAAASISSGQVLIGIADDLLPEKGWDHTLWNLVESELNESCFWKLRDTRCEDEVNLTRDDILPRHPAMTRDFYKRAGFFFDPRYVSVGCDDQLLCDGLMQGSIRDGRSFKLHHTTGKILKATGELNCGCEGRKESTSLSKSQIKIHDSRWVKLAEKNLVSTPIRWVAISDVSATPGVGTHLLRNPFGRSSFIFNFFGILSSHKIKFRNKSLFFTRFIKRSLIVWLRNKNT
jgi:hypothetical protein